MPVFRFAAPPDDALFEGVLAAFGFTPATLRDPRAIVAARAGPALDALRPRLAAVYRPRDRARCLPLAWDRTACLRVLRQVLRARGVALRSRVERAADDGGDGSGSATRRVHYGEGGVADVPRPVARRVYPTPEDFVLERP